VRPCGQAMSVQKRRRTAGLNELLHTGGVTTSALAEILAKVARSDLGCDADVGRHRLQRDNLHIFNQHKVAQDLQLSDGSIFVWSFLNPHTWLPDLVERSPRLQVVFAAALERYPVSAAQPWHLAVAFDEFAPGNKLQVDNSRKCVVSCYEYTCGPTDWATHRQGDVCQM
jgi:hypothetical protein